MFQTIQPKEIFDPRYWQVSEKHPAYWLAQLRKADWLELLAFVDVTLPMSTRKGELAAVALSRYKFEVSESREKAWLLCQALGARNTQALVIQYRHLETDWTRGVPEFINVAKGDTLGFVNIAARLVCIVQ
jgi:hypothetical protein